MNKFSEMANDVTYEDKLIYLNKEYHFGTYGLNFRGVYSTEEGGETPIIVSGKNLSKHDNNLINKFYKKYIVQLKMQK